jgi:hypothetical protein
MEYGGPFDLLTVVMVLILTVQWTLPFALIVIILGLFRKITRIRAIKLLGAIFAVILVLTWLGIHQCNTTYRCVIDSIPSLLL